MVEQTNFYQVYNFMNNRLIGNYRLPEAKYQLYLDTIRELERLELIMSDTNVRVKIAGGMTKEQIITEARRDFDIQGDKANWDDAETEAR